MKSGLEKRQGNLEETLQKEANITISDRLKNIGYNLSNNLINFAPLGIVLGFCGLVYWDFYTLVNHMELTSKYQKAYDIVNFLYDTQSQIYPEMVENLKTLIEQGSQQIYADKAHELLNGINENSESLLQGKYLETLKVGLSGLAESGKEMLLKFGGGVGLISGIFSFISTSIYAYEKSSWRSRQNETNTF